MDFSEQLSFPGTNITVSNYLSSISKLDLVKSIIHGLTTHPRHIASMFFYDAAGSKLFEEITRLPEYYAARTEIELIKGFANLVGKQLRDIDIVEFGSGDCSKISILFDAIDYEKIRSVHYKPLDVSLTALRDSANTLVAKYPGLTIHCIAADFITQLHLVNKERKRQFCFFGSTIGNFASKERRKFLFKIGQLMQSDDKFLVGVDMVKSKDILELAYNDSSNITARFNRNILNVVNSIIGTNFDVYSFKHNAFYNEKYSRIEMHLTALRDMVISSPYTESVIEICRGESIHTENSYKFTRNQIVELVETAGLKVESFFMDQKKWFSLLQLTKKY
jgi:L-histidine Nalpha-methyltransferase